MKKFSFVIVLAIALCMAGAAVAQTVVDTEVKSAMVIGKTDHSVIVKDEAGTVREIQVPPGKTAMVDGKEVGLADLKIGTMLTATVHTIATPVTVKTTTIKNGEVVKVQGANLTTKEADGFHNYVVPKGYRFNVDGKEVGIEDLGKGMKLNATIVTSSTKMQTSTKRAVAGSAPPTPTAAPMAAPAAAAAPAPAPAPVAEAAPAAPAKKKLPKTASPMALIALMGAASLATGLRLRRSN